MRSAEASLITSPAASPMQRQKGDVTHAQSRMKRKIRTRNYINMVKKVSWNPPRSDRKK